jgi:hypothetical protein
MTLEWFGFTIMSVLQIDIIEIYRVASGSWRSFVPFGKKAKSATRATRQTLKTKGLWTNICTANRHHRNSHRNDRNVDIKDH